MASGPTSVLKKKLSKIQSRGYNFPVQNQLAAKVEYAAARGATAVLAVTVEAIVEESRVTRLGPLIDTLPMPGLFIVMHAGAGDQALAGLDMRLVDHVVDIVAGGDPNNSESLPARKPTSLDAALCAPVIDAVMGQLHHEMTALAGDAAPERFRNGPVEHIPTNLNYMLSEQQYLSIRVNLDIGDNARTGTLYLALPLSWIEPIEPLLRGITHAATQNESTIWSTHMRKVVRRAPLTVTAVIDSFPMQVSDMAHLETGKLFPLPGTSIDDVRLELDTGSERRVIARGWLGIHKQCKAIKINEPLAGELFGPLAAALARD
jgi:flagellar motor switch protein FliM